MLEHANREPGKFSLFTRFDPGILLLLFIYGINLPDFVSFYGRLGLHCSSPPFTGAPQDTTLRVVSCGIDVSIFPLTMVIIIIIFIIIVVVLNSRVAPVGHLIPGQFQGHEGQSSRRRPCPIRPPYP